MGTEFQPPYAEMQNIITEITCGLLAFCLHVRKSVTSTVVTDRSTFGRDASGRPSVLRRVT